MLIFFFSKIIIKLLKYININNFFIWLEKTNFLFYSLIYNLKLVELEMLNIYIKIKLTSNIIKLFKFFINILILFIYKNKQNF